MTDDEGMTNLQGPRQDDASSWLNGERRVREEPDSNPIYDLEERTARFGEAVVDFAKSIPRGPTTDRIISQLVGAGTSVGANYVEADDSVSKKEFLKCIGTCKKEARRDQAFCADGGSGRSGAKIRSTKGLDGSAGIASDLFEDLDEWAK